VNHRSIIELQLKIAYLARGARELRGQLVPYAKSAQASIDGGWMTSGETPEALQKALPRLKLYVQMSEHLTKLADLFDEMADVVSAQNAPGGQIILPTRMLAQRAAAMQQPQATNGHNPTEEHAGRLYEAYCAAVGGKAHDGNPLPGWAEFRADATKAKQSEAWVRVAALSLSSAKKE
jgi:hypothetical protein